VRCAIWRNGADALNRQEGPSAKIARSGVGYGLIAPTGADFRSDGGFDVVELEGAPVRVLVGASVVGVGGVAGLVVGLRRGRGRHVGRLCSLAACSMALIPKPVCRPRPGPVASGALAQSNSRIPHLVGGHTA
jgi:hypothetical protein